MGKLVMGYWDCPYCNTKHIEGTRRECPSCGKPRGQEVKFYMDGVRYLSAEESQTKGKGADWLCDHCGNYNSALDTQCRSCGAVRGSNDKAYFDVRRAQDARNARSASGTGTAAGGQNGGQGSRKRGHSFGALKIALICVLVIAAMISLVAFITMPKKRTVTVKDMIWKTRRRRLGTPRGGHAKDHETGGAPH